MIYKDRSIISCRNALRVAMIFGSSRSAPPGFYQYTWAVTLLSSIFFWLNTVAQSMVDRSHISLCIYGKPLGVFCFNFCCCLDFGGFCLSSFFFWGVGGCCCFFCTYYMYLNSNWFEHGHMFKSKFQMIPSMRICHHWNRGRGNILRES